MPPAQTNTTEAFTKATEAYIKREDAEEAGLVYVATFQVASAIRDASTVFSIDTAVCMDLFCLDDLPALYSFFVAIVLNSC